MSLICLTNGKTHSQKLIVPPVICNFTGLLNPLRLRYLQKHFEDSQATFEGIHVVTPIAIGCCAAIPGYWLPSVRSGEGPIYKRWTKHIQKDSAHSYSIAGQASMSGYHFPPDV